MISMVSFAQKELERRLYIQSVSGYCGIAVTRSLLHQQFDIKKSEGEMLERVVSFYAQRYGKDGLAVFTKRGVSPQAMANVLRGIIPSSARMFCSAQGTPEQLQELREQGIVPVIHQLMFFLDYPPEGHYMIYCSNSGKNVRFFNSWDWVGLTELPREQFYKEWGADGSHWYFAVLPQGLTLPRERFKGKYL